MQSFLEPLREYCIWFLPVQCCLKSIKRTLHRIFFIQSCVEPLEQHGIRFSPVQEYFTCRPKSIRAKLHRIFSDAVFSGALWTRLHRVLTREMLSQEY